MEGRRWHSVCHLGTVRGVRDTGKQVGMAQSWWKSSGLTFRRVEVHLRPTLEIRRPTGRPQGTGYPTDWARIIIWSGRSFNFVPSACRSTETLAPVTRPSEAQKRYAFCEI